MSDSNNAINLIESGKVNFVVSTSEKGRLPSRDSVKLRRKTVERSIPCLTSIDTANAVIRSIRGKYSEESVEIVDINNMREEKELRKFVKMQGCGNDYIYFDCFQKPIENPEALSIRLSDRHYGIGGDGVVLICPSEVADAKMRMFNLDGSEGKMCGNATRCIGKYLYDNKIVNSKTITLETLSGIKEIKIFDRDGEAQAAMVNMGKAILNPKEIPVKSDKDIVVNEPAVIGGKEYNITCVSMGNPHCIVYVDDVDRIDIEKIGPLFEFDPLFPERVNTEFVTVIDKNTIKMRVWERGSGETLACGTGACAAAVASVLNGYCPKGEDVTVKLLGGDLTINYTDEAVFMTGKAVKVYEGVIEL